MRVSLCEYGVQNYPEGMEGWRMFRIEYGGHAMDCVTEGIIWLPPHVDPDEVEKMLNGKDEGRKSI